MTAIGEARKELQNGNIIIYPTDTVWGMGCDPFNQKAIDQLFNIKGKKLEGLSVMFDNIDEYAKDVAACILILAEAQYQSAFSVDKEINIMGMFYKLLQESK